MGKFMVIISLIEALTKLAPIAEGMFSGKGRGPEKAAFVTETLATAVNAADDANIIGKGEAEDIRGSLGLVPTLLGGLVNIFHSVGLFKRDPE